MSCEMCLKYNHPSKRQKFISVCVAGLTTLSGQAEPEIFQVVITRSVGYISLDWRH